jgi:predicted permease
MIGERYWHTRFGGDPKTVGKVVRMNDVPVTIVGILPAEFTGVQHASEEAADVGLPLSLDPQVAPSQEVRLREPTYWWLQVMGRLKPGATAEQVRGNLEGVFRATARSGLDSYLAGLSATERSASRNQQRTQVPYLDVASGSRGIYDSNESELRAVTILSIVVALVLLIVCANVANLLLSRATTRQKEISIRLSMGATRPRLIRQLLTEAVLLAAIGGTLGIVIGYWGKTLLPNTTARTTPIDWRVLAFVLAVTGVTGIIFGIAPAVRATGINVNAALKESSRGVVGRRNFLGKALLIVQVALSLVLLIGAGLFLRTLHNLRQVDVGFNPNNLVLFRINPQLNRYDEQKTYALYGQMLDRLRAIGGVRAVAMMNPPLLSGSSNSTGIFVQGRSYTAGPRMADNLSINRLVVSTNFFEAMEIPIVLGRGFTDRDNQTAQKVVVINETAVKKYFPNENPIGQHFGNNPEASGQLEIVGVLRDAKYNSVRDPAPPTMYVPYLQTRAPNIAVAVRTAGDPLSAMGAIRDTVRQVDPNLPIVNMTTQMDAIELRFLQEKTFAMANTLFGVLALLLAAVGLFGLMSYNVARRTNEIGVRMALGAQRYDVLRLILGESMILVVAGVAIGIGAALGASRLVATLLYGLAPTDMLTMTVAVVLMIAVSVLAGYLPARRAARVDPLVALHYE